MMGHSELLKNDKIVNGESILSVLSLDAEQGDKIVLQVDGDDEEPAVCKLTLLLEGDLG